MIIRWEKKGKKRKDNLRTLIVMMKSIQKHYLTLKKQWETSNSINILHNVKYNKSILSLLLSLLFENFIFIYFFILRLSLYFFLFFAKDQSLSRYPCVQISVNDQTSFNIISLFLVVSFIPHLFRLSNFYRIFFIIKEGEKRNILPNDAERNGINPRT